MFKAKLIENGEYYKLKNKQQLIAILLTILLGFFVNVYQLPVWLAIPIIAFYIAAMILMVRNRRQISAVVGNKRIEIDEEQIRIKSKKGSDETIHLNRVERIMLKDEYVLPQRTIKDVGHELSGKSKQNFVILYQNNRARQLDFEVDSYYMINQLDKLIETWKQKGYHLEWLKDN